MPNETIKLRQLLEQYVRDKVAKSEGKYTSGRISPLGIPEFVVDQNKSRMVRNGTLAVTSARPNPEIYYSPEVFNDTGVQQHERIHAGQSLLPENKIPINILQNIFGPRSMGMGTGEYFESHEVPAYDFMYPFDQKFKKRVIEQQSRANEFLDLMNRMNADQAEPLEAAMPPQMLTNFIRDYARRLSAPQVIKPIE